MNSIVSLADPLLLQLVRLGHGRLSHARRRSPGALSTASAEGIITVMTVSGFQVDMVSLDIDDAFRRGRPTVRASDRAALKAVVAHLDGGGVLGGMAVGARWLAGVGDQRRRGGRRSQYLPAEVRTG